MKAPRPEVIRSRLNSVLCFVFVFVEVYVHVRWQVPGPGDSLWLMGPGRV